MRTALPFPAHPDRLSEIDQGAVVEHKRLGHVLQVAQLIQAERDKRRGRRSAGPVQKSSAKSPLMI
jgi:hypothetical protein